jgi:hypothetical protein
LKSHLSPVPRNVAAIINRCVGLHADYLSFWEVDVLQAALDDPTCQHRENIFGDGPQCQTLLQLRNEDAMQSCILSSDIPQEEVGIGNPIPSLPGCNPLWSASGPPKGTCNSTSTPRIGPPNQLFNFNRDDNVNEPPSTLIPIYNTPTSPSTATTMATSVLRTTTVASNPTGRA